MLLGQAAMAVVREREGDTDKRPTRRVTIRTSGTAATSIDVLLPVFRKMPDILRLAATGKLYIRRDENTYVEATVWPVMRSDHV